MIRIVTQKQIVLEPDHVVQLTVKLTVSYYDLELLTTMKLSATFKLT